MLSLSESKELSYSHLKRNFIFKSKFKSSLNRFIKEWKNESSPSLEHVEAAPSGFDIVVREQIKSFAPKHAAQHDYSSGVRFLGSGFLASWSAQK